MYLNRRAVMTGLAAGLLPSRALAQQANGAPVRIVFPFAAGGAGDALCRLTAEALTGPLGRAVIVENRTGADGRIGIQAVKAAAPDGATLLVTTGPTMALMPQTHRAPGYDPVADFSPIATLARFEFCVAVANTINVKSMAELVAWMKANPEKATYGLPGLGTIPHFAGVALGKLAGVDLRRLPYRGGVPAMNDLVGGQIPIVIGTLTDALQQHQAGTVRMLATLGAARSPFVPDVPTLKESGYDITGDAWYGLWGPAGMAPGYVKRIADTVAAMLAVTEISAKLMTLGMIAMPGSPDDLERARRGLADNWAPTIRESGFTMEQ